MGESAGIRRTCFLPCLFSCLVLVCVFGSLLSMPSAVLAQDTTEKKADDTKPAQSQDMFVYVFESVGIVFLIVFLAMSVFLVTVIVLLALDVRMGVAVPTAFVEDFTDLVNKRQFKQAYELCRSDNSFLGRVLTAGMARLQYGIDDARTAALEMVESVKSGKEQLIQYLATIGTLGPLLGLVGTVAGMIGAFRKLATERNLSAEMLAGDISHALCVTLIGVALSVPAIFCHTFFRNRLIRVAMETSTMADDLLTQMYHNSKKAAAEPPRAAPAPTPAADPRVSAVGQRAP